MGQFVLLVKFDLDWCAIGGSWIKTSGGTDSV